ncbi:MAG TPA: hypothetical protein PK657_09750 [Legionella sp.]|nr:hypothetical protein [Legionella sp.]
MKKINSLHELSCVERKKVHRTGLRIGLLTCCTGVLFLVCMGIYPFTVNDSVFFFCLACLLSLNPPIFLFAFGYLIAQYAQLAKLGYKLPLFTPDFDSDHQAVVGSDEHSIHQPYSFSSSFSINPGSGLPMSGSSGMDIRGNPYGTSSW